MRYLGATTTGIAAGAARTADEAVLAAKTGAVPVTITQPSDIPKLVQYVSGQISDFQRKLAEEKIQKMVERGDRQFYVDPYGAYEDYGGRQTETPTWVWIAAIAGAAGIVYLMSKKQSRRR